jgi:hypothetical protein
MAATGTIGKAIMCNVVYVKECGMFGKSVVRNEEFELAQGLKQAISTKRNQRP